MIVIISEYAIVNDIRTGLSVQSKNLPGISCKGEENEPEKDEQAKFATIVKHGFHALDRRWPIFYFRPDLFGRD